MFLCMEFNDLWVKYLIEVGFFFVVYGRIEFVILYFYVDFDNFEFVY